MSSTANLQVHAAVDFALINAYNITDEAQVLRHSLVDSKMDIIGQRELFSAFKRHCRRLSIDPDIEKIFQF